MLQAVDILRVAYGEVDTRTAIAFHNLASVHEELGNTTEAAQFYHLAFEARCTILGETHTETLQTRLRIARLDASLGKYREAQDGAEKCAMILAERGKKFTTKEEALLLAGSRHCNIWGYASEGKLLHICLEGLVLQVCQRGCLRGFCVAGLY